MPANTAGRYPQSYKKNSWDHLSSSGCYMQRRSNDNSSEFHLKNGVAVEVAVGYNVYNGNNYNINTNTLLS